ncbi:MAG: hypothetical protein ACRD4F_10615 [Candidatus Angelobacter sp.]
MARQIALPFAAKTASELASRLGVSKARQKRIFAIVEKQHAGKTTAASGMRCSSRAKGKNRTATKPAVFTSRSRSRSNAKAAR